MREALTRNHESPWNVDSLGTVCSFDHRRLLAQELLTGKGDSLTHWICNPLQMHDRPDRPPPQPPIATEKLSIERKLFFLDLKENQRGRFLKITENVGGRRDTIILPADAFGEVLEVLKRLVELVEALSFTRESRSDPLAS